MGEGENLTPAQKLTTAEKFQKKQDAANAKKAQEVAAAEEAAKNRKIQAEITAKKIGKAFTEGAKKKADAERVNVVDAIHTRFGNASKENGTNNTNPQPEQSGKLDMKQFADIVIPTGPRPSKPTTNILTSQTSPQSTGEAGIQKTPVNKPDIKGILSGITNKNPQNGLTKEIESAEHPKPASRKASTTPRKTPPPIPTADKDVLQEHYMVEYLANKEVNAGLKSYVFAGGWAEGKVCQYYLNKEREKNGRPNANSEPQSSPNPKTMDQETIRRNHLILEYFIKTPTNSRKYEESLQYADKHIASQNAARMRRGMETSQKPAPTMKDTLMAELNAQIQERLARPTGQRPEQEEGGR